MAYQFPPDVARLVQEQMTLGGYASEDEVLRDALRALDEVSLFRSGPDSGRMTSLDVLRQEVTRGLEQLDRGEGEDAEAVFDELLRDLPSAE